MKKLLASFLTLLFLSASVLAGTINSYDKYGSKSGSYRTYGSTITKYNKYGSKEKTYKTHGNKTTEYNKYGSKTATYKKMVQLQLNMTNMEENKQHIKHQVLQLMFMINMAEKQAITRKNQMVKL